MLGQAQESLAYFLSLAETPVPIPITGGPSVEVPAPLEPGERRKKYDITLPLPIIKTKPLPPLCGPVPAPPSHLIVAESLVAAKVSSTPEWILAAVLRKTGQGKYDIMDCEDPEPGKLQTVSVIPFHPPSSSLNLKLALSLFQLSCHHEKYGASAHLAA